MMRNRLPSFLRLRGQAQFCQAYGAARDRWAHQIGRRPHPVAVAKGGILRGQRRLPTIEPPACDRSGAALPIIVLVQPGERPPTSSHLIKPPCPTSPAITSTVH